MVLPSNSSMNYYPDNTLTQYTTKLPQFLDLEGRWEVGLSEIQFPLSFYNVHTDEDTMKLLVWHRSEDGQYTDVDEKSIAPPSGHYDSVDQLVKHINARIKEVEYRPNLLRFSFNEITKKVTMRFIDEAVTETKLTVSKEFLEMLGFDWHRGAASLLYPMRPDKVARNNRYRQRDYKPEPERISKFLAFKDTTDYATLVPLDAVEYTGSRVCDLQHGFHALYVYCDIVEPTIVGDSRVPLLRAVHFNATKESNTVVHKIYQNVMYIPIHRNNFNTIEILIRTDTGESVPFESGTLMVTLHFRLRKPAYF